MQLACFIRLLIHRCQFSQLNPNPWKSLVDFDLSTWRNWLARSAVNRKDVGSSPTGDESLLIFERVRDLS